MICSPKQDGSVAQIERASVSKTLIAGLSPARPILKTFSVTGVAAGSWRGHMFQHACGADRGAARAPVAALAGADSHARFRVRATPLQGRLNGNGLEFDDFLVPQVGVGRAVSASLARQIENAVDCPDRIEGAGVAALERHLARPVVVDPVFVA